jgi:hypothetical protein
MAVMTLRAVACAGNWSGAIGQARPSGRKQGQAQPAPPPARRVRWAVPSPQTDARDQG